MDRLIDGYENSLLEKADFEPRILRVKERLKREEASLAKREHEVTGEEELRLLVGNFESFAEQIREGLEQLGPEQKREILKLLIKQIEVDRDEVRIVYKVQPTPFVPSPDKRGFLQDCLRFARTYRRPVRWDSLPRVANISDVPFFQPKSIPIPCGGRFDVLVGLGGVGGA